VKVNERTPDRTSFWTVVAVAVFAVLMLVASLLVLSSNPAKASTVQPAPVVTTVTVADLVPQPLAVATTTAARPGEGVIRITTRICGNANNWQNVAATNGIRANSNPPYLVLLGQMLTVPCVGGTAPVQQAAPPVRASGWTNPVPGACLGSPFGERRIDKNGNVYYHRGWDLKAGYGVPIHAAAVGTVSVGYQSGGAGYYTMINHGGGIWTVYMHESSFAVRSGWVGTGQVIGYVGSTGNSSGPHLHFEVHTSGLWNGRVNPVGFMSNKGVRLGC